MSHLLLYGDFPHDAAGVGYALCADALELYFPLRKGATCAPMEIISVPPPHLTYMRRNPPLRPHFFSRRAKYTYREGNYIG